MTDLRTRNNASSKKSYEKATELQYATAYEHYMIQWHKTNNKNTDVSHWTMVPEEWLYNSGVITNFNETRLTRLMNKKEKKEGVNRLRDYGFDGMARTLNGNTYIYHGLQAKYYTKQKVCASDIGTFLGMHILLKEKNTLSKAYLYTTSNLQIDLSGIIAAVHSMEHIFLPWKHPDARTDPKPVSKQLECDKPLREDQIDALKQLEDKDGINALNTPCRWGKTIVAGHHTKRMNAKLIVAIAPLLVSVENLQERLTSFLPSHTPLVVDSATGATTNPEVIKNFISSEGNHIIYSTFKSASDILSHLMINYKDSYILADEVHNIGEELCDFITKFPKGLVMSATLPEEIVSMLDINYKVYIPFYQAIRDKIIVDYTVWLPYLTKASDGTQSIDIEIPIEFSSYDTNFIAKALYLANVMLKTGSRRCIAYLTSQEDCDSFTKIVSDVFDIYHGLCIWTGKIDCTISKVTRKEILELFQADNKYDFHILTSVRILDEAVDIPRCDSVFISNVCEKSSDIRMMQRSQRSSTIDPTNLSKHNNIILWADGWEKCVTALESLREADPTFHKKIRIAHSNYDTSSDTTQIKNVANSEADLDKFIELNVQSLTPEKKQFVKVKEYVTYFKANGKPKANKGKYDDDSILERKLFYNRKYWAKSVNNPQYGFKLYDSSRLYLDEQIPGWSDDRETKQVKVVELYCDFVSVNKREPKDIEGESTLYNARRLWIAAEHGIGLYKLYPKSKLILNERHPNWYKSNVTKRQENANILVEFYKEYNRLPKYVADESISEEQKKENIIASILSTFKKNKSNPEYENVIIFLNASIPDWSSTFGERAIEKAQQIINHYIKEGDFPNDDSELGRFYTMLRRNIIVEKYEHYPYDTISKLFDESCPNWRLTRQEKRQKEQDEKVENIIQFYTKHGYFPISCVTNEDEESILGRDLIGFRQYVNKTNPDKPISDENIAKLDALSLLWRSPDSSMVKTCIKNSNSIKEFVTREGRLPKQKGITNEETQLGRILSKYRQRYKKQELPIECRRILEGIPGFII